MSREETLQILKQKRSAYKGVVTYFCGKLNDINSIGEVQSAISRLQSAYSKYEEIQIELEIEDEREMNDRTHFDDGYGKVEAVLLDKLDKLKQSQPNDTNLFQKLSSVIENASKSNSNVEVAQQLKFKLPEVPLIKFDGDKLKWLSFRDVFVSVIHSSTRLTNLEKFYYLHGSIKEGSAYRLIESIPVTNDNYLIAWDKLFNHYNNEFAIQQHHIRCIYEIKKPVENSCVALTAFVETIEKNLQALQALQVDHSTWSLFMNHHVIERLDNASKVEVLKKLPLDKLTSTDDLLNLIKTRIRLLENLGSHKISSENQRQSNTVNKQNNNSRALTTTNESCLYCGKSDHKIRNCSKFSGSEVSPIARFEFVKKHNLCTNCISNGHRALNCSSGSCRKCNMKHHTLLHFSKSNQSLKSENVNKSSHPTTLPSASTSKSLTASENNNSRFNDLSPPCQVSKETKSSSSFHIGNVLSTHVEEDLKLPETILATILLWVRSDKGYRIQCRALLDSGSQRNFVSQRMCQLLKASKQSINHSVSGFSGHVNNVRWLTNLSIHSRYNNSSHTLKFLIVPKICGNLPNTDIDLNKLNCKLTSIPNHINLADPLFYKSESVDMLIGVEIFNEILLSETFVMNIQLPPFRNSQFGYLIFGKLKQFVISSCLDTVNCATEQSHREDDLNSLLQRFWQLDQITSNPQTQWSVNEKFCEDHYLKHTIRLSSGRYSVALPVKPNINMLGSSQFSALQQFNHLEKRLNRDMEINRQYRDFMNDYLSLEHMEEVLDPESNNNQYGKTCFLPHHAVLKENSTTTKLRVVFNASSKTTSQLSLNDVLHHGPTIQHDLFSIVVRFRTHIFGISADITKMYRQILLHADQRDLHRIWWKHLTDDKIKCYRLKTVTYGTTCAPFLAIRTLFKLADDEISNFPKASQLLKRDFYVDDVLTGSDTIESALEIKSELKQLLACGGFDLRKWASNCLELNDITNVDNSSNIISVLGLCWNTESDIFRIQVKTESSIVSLCTKRSILSEIAQLYDPIGFISPVIVVAKHIMQMLWNLPDISWDDPLPLSIVNAWNKFRSELSLLNSLEIPRCIKTSPSSLFEIHAFGDASEIAYGSVVYVRTFDTSNNYVVRLLCSKSKIAPLKVQTIPRLELCAALLTAELVVKVLAALDNPITNVYFWSDSEITLCRIKCHLESTQTKLPIFEANRVAKIQEISSSSQWYYVPTKANPADVVSRGLSVRELIDCEVWWNGPSFLLEHSSSWPRQKIITPVENINNPENNQVLAVGCHVSNSKCRFSLFNKFSNLFKLMRVTAYLVRFVKNCQVKIANKNSIVPQQPIVSVSLKISEIDNALKCLVKASQLFDFNDEILKLSKGQFVSPKSKLKSLCPIVDDNQIVRVGGRLNNSDWEYNRKHPIVLSGSCTLSKLLVEYEHVKLLHAGPQQLLYNLRQRFWILNGRNLCKKIVHKCIKCFRVNPKPVEQLMGQLPMSRVQPSKPFHHVGIDFCGPFVLKYPFRSKITTKAYVCVFVCFVTRACHLEVVGDLSTQSFLASFRRFTSRRGRCAHAYSDNGTNFIGAKGELIELKKLLDSEYHRTEVLKFCTENAIEWHNIPPRSPHFGGLWEAAVKIAKTHMKRVVGDTSFTLEELTTLVVEIEACMNSRPLSPMSNDPSDLEVLSPSHFLIGSPLTALPDPDLKHLNYNRLKHFQQIQYLLQTFWKRWQNEVLSELQERNKWFKEPLELRVGMLVLLKEQNLPPLKWLTGRIIKLISGKDNVIRTVVVKTASSIFERAVANICILPVDDVSLDNLTKVT